MLSMIRLVAIILAFYLIYLGATAFILVYQSFSQPANPTTEILRYAGAIMPFLIGIVYFYGAYAVFKGQRDKFSTFIGLFIAQLIIALAIVFSGLDSRLLLQINPYLAVAVLGFPILLFLILILSRGKQAKPTPVQTARNTLEDHVQHLTDEELKEALKR